MSPCSVAGCFPLFETQKLAFVSCLPYGDLNLLPSTMASPPPPGAGQSYCWETLFVVPWQVTGTFREQPQKGLGEKEAAVWGGVGWGGVVAASSVFSSAGKFWVPLVLFKEKKYIYMKIKISKLIFSCYRKTNIKYYPCLCNHAVSVCASLPAMGWHLLRVGKIQQAAPRPEE